MPLSAPFLRLSPSSFFHCRCRRLNITADYTLRTYLRRFSLLAAFPPLLRYATFRFRRQAIIDMPRYILFDYFFGYFTPCHC